MSENASPVGERVRAAEVIAALSLATDLATRLPLEQGLESTLAAMRLSERLGVDDETARQTYYGCLLFYVGCTAEAEVAADLFDESALVGHLAPSMFGSQRESLLGTLRALAPLDGSAPLRAVAAARKLPRAVSGYRHHVAALCEVGEMLTDRLGLPPSIQGLFPTFTERWDGKGVLRRARGEGVPLPCASCTSPATPPFTTWSAVRRWPRGWCAAAPGTPSTRSSPPGSPTTSRRSSRVVPRARPGSGCSRLSRARGSGLEGAAIDRALAAMGDFADLASPYLVGHSAGVAQVAGAAAERCHAHGVDPVAVRRAALVHDLGRVAVPLRIWHKPGPLAPDEWERVRLHAYHSERVLSHSPRSSRWRRSPAPTTSVSTARATTAAPPPGRCRSRRACSPPPTPTAP